MLSGEYLIKNCIVKNVAPNVAPTLCFLIDFWKIVLS